MKKSIGIFLIGLVQLTLSNNLSNLAGKTFSIEELRQATDPIKSYIGWHLKVPAIGLTVNNQSKKNFIPHCFDLWQLAPHKGKGVTIVLLDTGVAAFSLENQCYKKHPYLAISPSHLDDNLNYIHKYGFTAFLRFFKKYLKPATVVNEKALVAVITEYCTAGSTQALIVYLKEYGIPELFSLQGNLTSKGEQALFEITQGKHGIMPHGKIRFFTPVEVSYPVCKKCILEFLPLAAQSGIHNNLCAVHGTHVYGILQAGNNDMVIGLAPHAHCIMIKACNDNGISDYETLLQALQKAKTYNPDIVNLSLKIENSVFYTDNLKALLNQFPYIVASSGNKIDTKEVAQESYPARFDSIPFDVGSFSFDGDHSYPISPFSQYERCIGPKFVAPGFNILSCGFPAHDKNYLFLSGTSCAAGIMSGLVALIVGEFKQCFSREQLLKVCYCSTVRLEETPEWKERCLLGALDIRTALFILHVSKRIKKRVGAILFNQKFNNIVRAVHTVLHAGEYFSCNENLEMAIDFFASLIIEALNAMPKKVAPISHALFERLVFMVKQPEIDMLQGFDSAVKKRLNAALYS